MITEMKVKSDCVCFVLQAYNNVARYDGPALASSQRVLLCARVPQNNRRALHTTHIHLKNLPAQVRTPFK